jgi:hypothetical protein
MKIGIVVALTVVAASALGSSTVGIHFCDRMSVF